MWVSHVRCSEIPLARLTELFNANNFIVSHVPSLWSARLSAFDPASASHSLVAKVEDLVAAEVAHRAAQLAAIGLLPRSLARLSQMAKPTDLGDVRMRPTITVRDLKHMLASPTPAFLQYCLLKGQRAAWYKMTAVRVRCAIEAEIEKAIRQLRGVLKLERDTQEEASVYTRPLRRHISFRPQSAGPPVP